MSTKTLDEQIAELRAENEALRAAADNTFCARVGYAVDYVVSTPGYVVSTIWNKLPIVTVTW